MSTYRYALYEYDLLYRIDGGNVQYWDYDRWSWSGSFRGRPHSPELIKTTRLYITLKFPQVLL